MTLGVGTAGIRQDYPEPLWIQAANFIAAEIESGALKPGSRLPPERELCQQLGISRVTLRKALGKLVDDALLTASHGRGWYVSETAAAGATEWPNSLESFTETAARMGLVATSRVLRASTVPASFDDAEELSVAPGTQLFVLERVRHMGGVPIAVDRTRLPADRVPGFESVDFTTASLYSELLAAGLQITHAESTIEAQEAAAEVAAHLGLEPGKPVLVLHQVVVDDTGRPLFASTVTYGGERYRLRTSFSRRR